METGPDAGHTDGGVTLVTPGESRPLVDAVQFLDVATRLREVRDRLDAATLADGQRTRLHRRLAAIAAAAAVSLDGAARELDELERELERAGQG